LAPDFVDGVLKVHLDLSAFSLIGSKGDSHDEPGHLLPGILQPSGNVKTLDELVDLMGVLDHGRPSVRPNPLDGLSCQALMLSKYSHGSHRRAEV
jgi:hypothetical protein